MTDNASGIRRYALAIAAIVAVVLSFLSIHGFATNNFTRFGRSYKQYSSTHAREERAGYCVPVEPAPASAHTPRDDRSSRRLRHSLPRA